LRLGTSHAQAPSAAERTGNVSPGRREGRRPGRLAVHRFRTGPFPGDQAWAV